jgi:DNA-binding GntR family transcriptional regulator
MVTMLFDLSERYQRTALQQAVRSDQSRREHADMAAALAGGDLEGLVALVERHNAGTSKIVRPHLD